VTFDYTKYTKHLSQCQNSSAKHQCTFCGAILKTFGTYKEHIQYVHAKDGLKINCYFCEKPFIPGHKMETHFRIHTREKPNISKYCHAEVNYEASFRHSHFDYWARWHKAWEKVKRVASKMVLFLFEILHSSVRPEFHMKIHPKRREENWSRILLKTSSIIKTFFRVVHAFWLELTYILYAKYKNRT